MKKLTKEAIINLRDEYLPPGFKEQLLNQYDNDHPVKFLGPKENLFRFRQYFSVNTGEKYRISHENLILKASITKTKVGPSVTNFSSWIHSLYLNENRTKQFLEGKKSEIKLEKLAKRFVHKPSMNGWKLIFRDTLDDSRQSKSISSLTINGQPIRGIPDLVFKHKRSGKILIVERKTSFRNKQVPLDGWPDLRAQLWAYGHCDEWKDAPRVQLAGEIWGIDGLSLTYRGTVSWDRDDLDFQSKNRELFKLYGGSISE